MIQNLSICHIPKQPGVDGGLPPGRDECARSEWLLFETCQRRVYISMDPLNSLATAGGDAVSCGGEFYLAEKAYGKLLSILCGLESRILAETEVFGQFKVFASSLPANSRFKRLAQDLIIDVRELRKSCLTGVGLRSYGSLGAHHVAGLQSVAIIGGGQLAQKILPYLFEAGHDLSMYLRRPSRVRMLPERFRKNLKVHSLFQTDDFEPARGLVIAAPVASSDVENWLQATAISPRTIVDMRDQRADRRLAVSCRLVTLDDLFEQMQKVSELLEGKAENARRQVEELTRRRFSSRHFRPFGWEDICA